MADDYFLSFEDAVSLTNQMVAFFNSERSDAIINALADKFGLEVRNPFYIHVDEISRNCKNCMGCHGGSCVLGCMTGDINAAKICYWDEALEQRVGTKLVKHEFGHLLYEQGFNDGLPEDLHFDRSEVFAQFIEKNLNLDMNFAPGGISSNPVINKFNVDSIGKDVLLTIVVGTTIAISVNAFFYFLEKRDRRKLRFAN